jgi:uncharacterized protein (DUF1015 family)
LADVRPFRGLRFNPQQSAELGDEMCPPFDGISPEQREQLLARSPHNVVRLELPKPESEGADVYAQSAKQLQEWSASNVLIRDEQPTYYLMQEDYTDSSGPHQRIGIYAAVHLEEYERGIVLPHEHTRRGPKEDRLAMMEACVANFSPIMGLYRDSGGIRPLLLNEMASRPPEFTAAMEGGSSFKVWAMQDAQASEELRTLLKRMPIYIADGHHRYETALAYRDNVREREKVRLDSQGSEFVMMCLIDVEDPGMQLHEFHRALSGLTNDKLSAIQEQVYGLFTVESRPLGGMTAESLGAFLSETWKNRAGNPTLGLIEPEEGRLSLLTLRRKLPPGSLPFAPTPDLYQCEAWLLHQAVLDPVLGGTSGDQSQVDYVPELDVLLKRIADGTCQAAFLVPPLDMTLFESLVREGQRLPPKSTFFLPKLPTGLVMNLLSGDI